MSGSSSLEHQLDSKRGPKAPPFKYKPLSTGQIRLLQLNPAKEETDELSGELIVKSVGELPPRRSTNTSEPEKPIDPEKHVCYEAISYVWGKPIFTDSLITSHGSISITASLSSILRRVRSSTEPRLYWADSLCINQSDIAEKEVQICIMDVIYSSAVRVLCDLGEEEEDTSIMLDAMERYWKRNIRHGCILRQQRHAFPGQSLAKILGIHVPSDEEADAIEKVKGEGWPERYLRFMSSPWFHRVWVVQEFVLGRDVVMIFGRRHIPWAELWAGTLQYKGEARPWNSFGPKSQDSLSTVMSYGLMCGVRTWRLLDLSTPLGREFSDMALGGVSPASLPLCMLNFSHHGCTIPRDRYFAILGIVDEKDGQKPIEFRPDYGSPLRDITIRFWSHALQTDLGGELLLSAGLPGLTKGYPSWLRDLTAPKPLSHVWIERPVCTLTHNAGGAALSHNERVAASTWSAVFSDDDPDQLLVQGHYIDDITDKSSLEAPGPYNFEWLFHWLRQAFTLFKLEPGSSNPDTDKRYPLSGEYMHEALLKTVLGFSTPDMVAPNDKEFEAISRLALCLTQMAFSSATEDETVHDKILHAFQGEEAILRALFFRVYGTRGMRVFRTSGGLSALLPKDACVGDSIWVLKGVRLPVVLRPNISHDGSFAVVGGGYVYGIMNGEAMETPGFEWREVSLR